MTDNTEARIRLAEFVGRRVDNIAKTIPDPFTSDTDCMALVKALNERGINIEITFFADGECWVQIDGPNHNPLDRYEGDDYKQGVCELALKVLVND